MAEIITTNRNHGVSAPSTRQELLSKASRVISVLAKMAIRRQAKDVGQPDFTVYAEDLMKYDEADIIAACDALGNEERGEGEPAFPTVPTIRRRIQQVIAAKNDPLAEMRAYERDIRENPEKYERVDFEDMVQALLAKHAIEPVSKRKDVDAVAANPV